MPEEIKEEISNSTVIGRRLEPDHLVDSSVPGTKIYSFKAFVDDRVTYDLSFDALGYTGTIQNKVLNAVKKCLRAHITSTNIDYIGWAGIKKTSLHPSHKVYLTPDENVENPNPHHCDLDRSNFRNKPAARSLAFELMAVANNEKMYVSLE